ncbi:MULTISPECIES: SRPBCC family protein [unclassified Microbacterium]|uniref:SRPBCC family protein n=1 Tax=unclassified Microbacterium TaxID=2609290 RepID=UPI00214C570C|nr:MULTISPECIES: SRPBCC family protein [unclassified Microbacterium]MCR2784409.1 SRPBCC family protein [Microbacterium sp. zg.B96]WIM14774.1 SRPBCC family protein [Microbacterium sp. zg-B96]
MGRRGIYVEITIGAPIADVWTLTQDAAQHGRWDVRFSEIRPTGHTPAGATRFAYTRRVPLHTVAGTGVSLGETSRPDGSRTSALRFATEDRLSPIRTGRGYWRYTPVAGGTRFITGYDYAPGWGRLPDLLVRPVLGWATAWSFDRLRIWLEHGEGPERWPLRSVLWFWRSDRPRAARCRRAPLGGSRRDDHLRTAPATLAALPDPEPAR